MITISIVNDFDEYPGLRNCSISEASGEEFYHKILNKKFVEAYNTNDKLEVILDGTGGFASSFLDEAFGNLVYDFTLPVVKQRLIIISNEEPHWKDMIESQTMPQWEERRKRNENVKTTAKHDVWGRLLNGKIELKKMEYACVITTADWINIASVIVNICIAIWITHILQNKFTNNRTLKDHFINEIKDVRAEYKGFLNRLYSNSTNPKELLPWFKLMNIRVKDLVMLMNNWYEVAEDFLNPYQNDLRELITESDDFNRCYKNRQLILTENLKRDLMRFQQEHQRLFNELIIKINDSNR